MITILLTLIKRKMKRLKRKQTDQVSTHLHDGPDNFLFSVLTCVIDLIHDTRHLCTRLRTDGIEAMSHGFSGGKQVKKIGSGRNRG